MIMVTYAFEKFASRAADIAASKKHRPDIGLLESKKSLYITLADGVTPDARENILSQLREMRGVTYAASTCDADNNLRVLLDDANNGPAAKAAAGKLSGVRQVDYGQAFWIAPPGAKAAASGKVLQFNRKGAAIPAPAIPKTTAAGFWGWGIS
jgi:hypothetical protein